MVTLPYGEEEKKMSALLFKILSFSLVLIILVTSCKKKESGFSDEEWHDEFAKISYNICAKLSDCSSGLKETIKPGLKKYFENEIKPEKCSERSKKSRIYNLKSKDPLKMKEVSRNCAGIISRASCDEIKQGIQKTSEDCKLMESFQKGL